MAPGFVAPRPPKIVKTPQSPAQMVRSTEKTFNHADPLAKLSEPNTCAMRRNYKKDVAALMVKFWTLRFVKIYETNAYYIIQKVSSHCEHLTRLTTIL